MLSNFDEEAAMRAYRPDRVVTVLGGLVTTVYVLAWVFALVSLVWMAVGAVLTARGYTPRGVSVAFGIGTLAMTHEAQGFRIAAPVTVAHPELRLPAWRGVGGRVEVSEVRAAASVPMASLSAGFVGLVWAALAAFWALVLLFLHELRRLFRRVQQGAPFDPGNAARLRWLGLLLLGAAVWAGVTEFWMSVVLSRVLEGAGDALGTGLNLDLPVIFVALVLIALAEIFRRGAALEDEQALVV